MSKSEGAAALEIRADFILIDISLLLIGNQNHRDVSSLDGLSNRQNLQAVLLCDLLGLAALIQADNDIDAAFLQVQRMGMALAAVTDDSNRLAVHDFPVDILIIISFCHSTPSPHNAHK